MQRFDPDRIAARLARVHPDEHGPPLPERAAVALLLRHAEEPEVLLMLRAEREGDPWSGQVSLPGGRAEPEDADLVATAVRETREELGVELDAGARLLGALPRLRARARAGLLPMDVSPYVFHAEGEVRIELGEEAREAFWLPLARAAGGELDHPYRYERERRVHLLPSWRLDGRVVWGMTHRILSSLLERLEDAPGP